MNSLLENLNPMQQRAVLATEGPALIIAGPGAGKTKTISNRVAHLIQKGVPPDAILAVTFTNKAAAEMRERITHLLENWKLRIGNLFVGTFHSFALRILQEHPIKIGYAPRFTIMDADDSLALVKDIIKDLGINPKQIAPGVALGAISRLKNELTTPERYQEEASPHEFFPHTIARIFTEYQNRLRASNAMDFDDLLMNTVLLFEKHPDVLARYQERFRYLHVDEWQDTNHAQYVLVSQLAKKYRNIAVVGDDAQSIYSFRGADFRNILDFEKDWPDATVVILDQNYRSPQIILDAASALIMRNKQQRKKQLWTEREEGEPIRLLVAGDERKEAELVWEEIRQLKKEGFAHKDMVVLYRTNAQSRPFEELLVEHRIPYKLIGGVRFYQRKEVKDILAYLRLLSNPQDAISLKRIINTPPRGIGPKTFAAYASCKESGENQDPRLKQFEELCATLRHEMAHLSADKFLRAMLGAIRYREYLEEHTPNPEERWENVEELASVAAHYRDFPPPKGIEQLLADAALMSDQDEVASNGDQIHLMTVHAAKGLEFPVVFLAGLEEGIFPHSRSLFNARELEEERRLCYVGITRAKDRLYLSCALRRMIFGSIQANQPSRFLTEIPEELLEVKEEVIQDL